MSCAVEARVRPRRSSSNQIIRSRRSPAQSSHAGFRARMPPTLSYGRKKVCSAGAVSVTDDKRETIEAMDALGMTHDEVASQLGALHPCVPKPYALADYGGGGSPSCIATQPPGLSMQRGSMASPPCPCGRRALSSIGRAMAPMRWEGTTKKRPPIRRPSGQAVSSESGTSRRR